MSVSELQPAPFRHRLRWYQCSLRTLLLVMLLACIGMSWVGATMQRAKGQREAVQAITKVGGRIAYDYDRDDASLEFRGCLLLPPPPAPLWLRNLLGDDVFTHVVLVDLCGTPVTDAGLEHLEGLTHLEYVCLITPMLRNRGLGT